MEKDSSQQPQAVFSSNEIGRKGKTNYFTNIKRKRTAKEAAKQLNPFKGKRKFITIPVLAVLVIGIILLLCFIFIWNRPADTEVPGGAAGGRPDGEFYVRQQELSEIYMTARGKVSDNDFSEAIAYIDEQIANSDDFNHRVSLIMMKADIYSYFENWQGALDVLLGMEPSALGDEAKNDYYLRLEDAYTALGNKDKAAEAATNANPYWGETPEGEENE